MQHSMDSPLLIEQVKYLICHVYFFLQFFVISWNKKKVFPIIKLPIISLKNITENRCSIHFYLHVCNYCLSWLTLWVRTPLSQGVLDTALCEKACQWLVAGRWFSPGTLVSSINKKDEPILFLPINLSVLCKYLHWYNCTFKQMMEFIPPTPNLFVFCQFYYI